MVSPSHDKITVGTPANREDGHHYRRRRSRSQWLRHRIHPGPREIPHTGRVGGCSGHRPRPGRAAEVQPRGQPALQRPRNGDQLPAGDGFAHSSNEPVQALGTGITLDSPLAHGHAIDAVVRDAAVTTAGYQGTPAPNQWFGGPEFITNSPLFGRIIPVRRAAWCCATRGTGCRQPQLRRARRPVGRRGLPGTSGTGQSGCHAPAPGAAMGFGPAASLGATTVARAASRTEPTPIVTAPISCAGCHYSCRSVCRTGRQYQSRQR